MQKTLTTHWELWTYDLWGNEEDGYTVNDRFCIDRDYIIRAKVTAYNVGTDQEFRQAEVSDAQIRRAFGIDGEFTTDGEPGMIYVSDSEDNPLCEMICTSHDSLMVNAKGEKI